MYGTIQKWGNSHAIRIPKIILEEINLQENDKVVIEREEDRIIIKRVEKKYQTLKELFSDYTEEYKCEEWLTGQPKGNEVW